MDDPFAVVYPTIAMRALAEGYRQSNVAAATMLRREWQHGARTR